MSAIVTFARNRIAYTTTKSLAQKGIKVISCDSIYPAMTFFSRYSNSFFLYPSYTQNPISFIHCMLDHVISLKPKVLMPSHEETYIISYFKDRFEKYKVPISSYEKWMLHKTKLR